MLASTGFKAPNLDDVTKFMDSRPGNYLVVPNPGLKPEYSYNGELGVSYVFKEKGYNLDSTNFKPIIFSIQTGITVNCGF